MNKDEVKGKMKDVVGRAERKLGKATGNMKTETRRSSSLSSDTRPPFSNISHIQAPTNADIQISAIL